MNEVAFGLLQFSYLLALLRRRHRRYPVLLVCPQSRSWTGWIFFICMTLH